jgi:hypothetical protein
MGDVLMAQRLINPIIVRAVRADDTESYDSADAVTWIVVNEKTDHIFSRHGTFDEARAAQCLLVGHQMPHTH